MRRRLQIAIYAVIIVVVVGLTAVLSAAVQYRSSFGLSDRLSAINDVFAGAALLLGLSAAVIALQGFAATTGRPDIKVQLWQGADAPNRIVLVSEPDRDGRLRSDARGDQEVFHIRLENRADFGAEDLSVSVHLHGAAFDCEFDTHLNGWRIVDAIPGQGAIAAEWFGDSAFHGRTSRRLPSLDTRSLLQLDDTGDCSLEVILASTGYLRRTSVSVLFVDRYTAARDASADREPPAWL